MLTPKIRFSLYAGTDFFQIFERAGRIYELRLMMDFSGLNRGYFFVRYTNSDDAKRAARELNRYPIRSGFRR